MAYCIKQVNFVCAQMLDYFDVKNGHGLFCLESVVMQPLSHAIFIYITNMANEEVPND